MNEGRRGNGRGKTREEIRACVEKGCGGKMGGRHCSLLASHSSLPPASVIVSAGRLYFIVLGRQDIQFAWVFIRENFEIVLNF